MEDLALLNYLHIHTQQLIQNSSLLLVFIWCCAWLFVAYFGPTVYQMVSSALIRVLESVTELEIVSRLQQQHNSLYRCIQARFCRQELTGLPLTLFCVALIMLVGLLAGVVEDVVNRETIVSIDLWLAEGIAHYRTYHVANFFAVLTAFGNAPIVLVVLSISTLSFIYRKLYRYIIGLCVSFTGSMLSVAIGKITFHRPRPDHAMMVEHSYSLPSGHATLSVALYGLLFFLCIRHSHNWHNKVSIAFAGTTFILCIGISRLVLDVHYISDVVAGFLLGTIWMLIGISLIIWSERHKLLGRAK